MEMNYTLGSVVTIEENDYVILPPRNLTAPCEGCDFKKNRECHAPVSIPCAHPNRIYRKVTKDYRTIKKPSVWGFIKWIINNR